MISPALIVIGRQLPFQVDQVFLIGHQVPKKIRVWYEESSVFLLSFAQRGKGRCKKGWEEAVRKTSIICLLPVEFRFNQGDPNESGNTRSPEVFP